jgi:Tol biopolymer transport system component
MQRDVDMSRLRKPTARLLAGSCLLVSLGAIPTASGSPSALPVRTLLEVRGSIQGFAQDGRYITWANPSPADRDRRACTRIVQLRDLETKKSWPLVGKKSSLCGESGVVDGFQHRMALAGTRALWGIVDGGISSFHVALHTARRGTPSRALSQVSMDAGPPGDRFRPVPVAGDASSLVYAHTGDIEEQRPYGVARVGRTGRSSLIPETEYTTAVAVQAGRTLLARRVEPGCTCNHSPTWSPNGEQIAFLSGRAEGGLDKGELHVIRADGSGLRVLPVGKGVWAVRWSPDGRMLAFARSSFGDSEHASILVADADGRSLRRVGTGFQPTWSPDGRWLAFTRYASPYSVFRVPVSGGAPVRIAAGASPDWSPDGTRLVVTRDDGLYVVRTNGTGARRIATARSPVGRWSPDGSRIAYSTDSDKRETWVVAPDGSGRRLSSTSAGVLWSPDSRSIVGTRATLDDPREDLVVIAADGSGERTLGPGWSPTWSRDGTTIAFATPGDYSWAGEIARVGPDGSDRRVLTQTTPEPGRNVIELRATATGRVLKSFNTVRLPEIRNLNGEVHWQGSLEGAENLSFSGHWVVYRTGRMIRGLDVRNGRSILIARAANVPVGLSLDGRRVAWAEQPTVSKSRIRAALLPS